MIGVFYTQPHYWDHMEQILIASQLPWRIVEPYQAHEQLCLIASGGDAEIMDTASARYVYVEHGSGQTYERYDHPSYAGGRGMGGCRGFICPSRRVAERWSTAYPYTPAAIVGCPKLDPWHRGIRPVPTDMTVCVTFHWDCNVSKFSRWAFPHYRRELPSIVDAWRRQGWIVIGHAHPRARDVLERYWGDIGVEYVQNFDAVLDRANILVADNSSVIPEFMSLGRPAVMLNAPWYNRSKHVGGRFWEWNGAGPMFDGPEDLATLDLSALAIEDPYRAERQRVVDAVYDRCDGHAATRAGAFLREVYERSQ